jgi:hypothetical protein
MSNGSTPAMPTSITYKKLLITTEDITGRRTDHGMQDFTERMDGLTKREHLAGLAMQGLCIDSQMNGVATVKLAVLMADALLKELDK